MENLCPIQLNKVGATQQAFTGGLTSNILRVIRAAFFTRKEFSASVGLSGERSITALNTSNV
jgi:hypothetical protein